MGYTKVSVSFDFILSDDLIPDDEHLVDETVEGIMGCLEESTADFRERLSVEHFDTEAAAWDSVK
jgi:hypothetical protein